MKDYSNITPELLETVERYYNGTMAKDEYAQFKAQLQKDAAFKTQVEDVRATLLAIEKQTLKERLDEFHLEIPDQDHHDIHNRDPNKPTVKIHFLIFVKIAIAAAIVIGLGVFWYLSDSPNEKLYSEYFKPDPGLPTTMSSSDNYVFYDGMVNYKQGDYKTAISKWKTLEKNSKENDTLNYFLGVAYLADKNEDQAIFYLDETTKNSSSVFQEDAYFYLGMAYLKSDKTKAARRAFQQSNSKKSREILEQLN